MITHDPAWSHHHETNTRVKQARNDCRGHHRLSCSSRRANALFPSPWRHHKLCICFISSSKLSPESGTVASLSPSCCRQKTKQKLTGFTQIRRNKIQGLFKRLSSAVVLSKNRTAWERHSYCQDMPLQCPSLHFLQLLSAVASFYQCKHTKHTLPQLLQTHKIHSTSTAANTHSHTHKKPTTSIAANTPKTHTKTSMFNDFQGPKKGSSKLMKGT